MFTHIKRDWSETGSFYIAMDRGEWCRLKEIKKGTDARLNISPFLEIRGMLNDSCKVEYKSHSTAGETSDQGSAADRAESLLEVQVAEGAGKPET